MCPSTTHFTLRDFYFWLIWRDILLVFKRLASYCTENSFLQSINRGTESRMGSRAPKNMRSAFKGYLLFISLAVAFQQYTP